MKCCIKSGGWGVQNQGKLADVILEHSLILMMLNLFKTTHG